MLAKLISEYEILLAVHGSEDKDCLENAMLFPAFKEFIARIAQDLLDEKVKNRHIVRVKVQVHAEDRAIENA